MNAKELAKATGVRLLTLNSWAHRGLIPGTETGMHGIARHYSLDQAVHVAILAALSRHRHSAQWASRIAAQRRNYKRLLLSFLPEQPDPNWRAVPDKNGQLTMYPKELFGQFNDDLRALPTVHWFSSEGEIAELFRSLGPLRPTDYLVVDIERITERMRSAEKQSTDAAGRSHDRT